MDPLPSDLLALNNQMSGIVFCAGKPNGIYLAPEIELGMRHLTRLGLPQISGCRPCDTWGKILLCYRGHGGTQFTTIVGTLSWYRCIHEFNLRLDVDRELIGQGACIWGPFIMAIAKIPDETPDFLEPDPDGQHFIRLAQEHCW